MTPNSVRSAFRNDAPARTRAALALLAALFAPISPAAAAEPELLDPEKAFRISTRGLDRNNVEVRFQIADGYYLYRDRFRFETAAGQLLADVRLPKGDAKEDPFFGKTEIYRREVRIRVPVAAEDAARGNMKIRVTSQGCADVGVCYVPVVQLVEVRLPGGSSVAPAAGTPPSSPWSDGLPEALRQNTPPARPGRSR